MIHTTFLLVIANFVLSAAANQQLPSEQRHGHVRNLSEKRWDGDAHINLSPYPIFGGSMELTSQPTGETALSAVDDATEMSLVVMCLFFGLVTSLLATAMGYWSCKEDFLVRRYLKDAEVLTAEVVSSDDEERRPAALAPVGTGSGQEQDDRDLLLTVEYECKVLPHDYTYRVQKRIKAKMQDVRSGTMPHIPSRITLQGMAPPQEEQETATQEQDESQPDAIITSYNQVGDEMIKPNSSFSVESGRVAPMSSPARQTSRQEVSKFIDVYVLPSFPQSGMGKDALQRKLSLSYRCPTVGVVCFLLATTAFCVLVAMSHVSQLMNPSVGWTSVWVVLVCMVLEVPLLYMCCDGVFSKALEDEYLQDGEMVQSGMTRNGSSLSSFPAMM